MTTPTSPISTSAVNENSYHSKRSTYSKKGRTAVRLNTIILDDSSSDRDSWFYELNAEAEI